MNSSDISSLEASLSSLAGVNTTPKTEIRRPVKRRTYIPSPSSEKTMNEKDFILESSQTQFDGPNEQKIHELKRKIKELEQLREEYQSLSIPSIPTTTTCIPYQSHSPTIDSEVGKVIYHGSMTLAKLANALGTIATGFGELAEAADEGHKTYKSGQKLF
jgi:hypothetical protein